MFMANAPWATTGYGVQGKHLTPRLKELGYDLTYFAFYGLAGGVLRANGVKVLPMANQPWGEDILAAHMAAEKADVLITLVDVWVTDWFGRKAQKYGWDWLPWTPIDQSPVPKLVLERLEGCKFVLPYSKFGESELHAAGVDNVRYVPHGLEPATYHPLDKTRAKRTIGVPEDAFVVGMVAANKGLPARKCFAEQLLAFRNFQRNHPKAIMYIHTLKTDAQGGVEFSDLLENLELEEDKDVFFTNQYRYALGLPEGDMAVLYNAFDILSEVSMSEGFGLPIIEAQACGVPVVTNDSTSMPELTFAGRVVKEGYPYWTPLGAWTRIPDYRAITRAYEEVYEELQERPEQLREEAIAGTKPYHWDNIVQSYWKPLLEEIANGRK